MKHKEKKHDKVCVPVIMTEKLMVVHYGKKKIGTYFKK